MFGESGTPDTTQMACGLPIDGRAVGKPGEQLHCRGTEFRIGEGQGGTLTAYCMTCRRPDRMRVRQTNTDQHGQNTARPPRPPDLPANAQLPPDTLQCLHPVGVTQQAPQGHACPGWRFRLYERGSEVYTKCVLCNNGDVLGVMDAFNLRR